MCVWTPVLNSYIGVQNLFWTPVVLLWLTKEYESA
jgi:hypothetical protein